MRSAGITALGSFVPAQRLKNVFTLVEFLRKHTLLDKNYIAHIEETGTLPGEKIKNDYWTSKPWFDHMVKTKNTFQGIHERRFFPMDPSSVKNSVIPHRMTSTDSEVLAGAICMSNAGVLPQDIDLLISFSMKPECEIPSTASLIQHKLGLSNSGAFRMDACCATAAYMIQVAESLIALNMNTRVLCTTSYHHSSNIDPSEYVSTYLGDGAAAILIEPSKYGGVGCTSSVSNGEAHGITYTTYEPPTLNRMYSHGENYGSRVRLSSDKKLQHVFIDNMKKSTEYVVSEALRKSRTAIDDIQFLVTHQAVHWSGKQLCLDLGVPLEKHLTTFHTIGNVAAVSPVVNLNVALHTRKLVEGDPVLFACTGAGSTAIAHVERIDGRLSTMKDHVDFSDI